MKNHFVYIGLFLAIMCCPGLAFASENQIAEPYLSDDSVLVRQGALYDGDFDGKPVPDGLNGTIVMNDAAIGDPAVATTETAPNEYVYQEVSSTEQGLLPNSNLCESSQNPTFSAVIEGSTYQSFITIDNEVYLYIPSRVGSEPLSISSDISCYVDGGGFAPSTTLYLDEGRYAIKDENGVVVTYLTVSISNINEVSIFLADATLEQIDSGSKDTKYYHNTAIINGENTQVVDTDLEIKGRGNTTWNYEKKPYQIKLSKKVDLFGMGKAKTWILLANYGDPSLLRNAIASELGINAGIEFNPEGRFVDLWVDGRYIGNYYLMEKIQINAERVNLTDLYGVLVEIDNAWYMYEDYWYYSKTLDACYVLKDSVAESQDRQDFIQVAFDAFRQKMNLFESLIVAPNPDWDAIGLIADLGSLARNYLVQEFCGDIDSSFSSIFVYTDSLSDKLHFGPLWDFDAALGNGDPSRDTSNPNIDLIGDAIYKDWARLEYYSVYKLWNILHDQYEFIPIIHAVYPEVRRAFDVLISSFGRWELTLAKSANADFSKHQILGVAVHKSNGRIAADTYGGEIAYLYNWINSRAVFFEKRFNPVLIIGGHSQDKGWAGVSWPGDYVGTVGESKRLEAVEISINPNYSVGEDDSIAYKVHVSNIGWMDWVSDGIQAGTTGISQQIEAIRVVISGAISEMYDVFYRLHIADYGWLDWASNGEKAGSEGLAKRAEALQILLIPKGSQAPGSTDRPFVGVQKYASHVANIGWQATVADSDMAGTVGLGLGMEAITISRPDVDAQGSIEYRVHVSILGWQGWCSDGEIAGTVGQSLSIEAIEIRLTGELAKKYDVMYIAHVANLGWLDWVSDGQLAGTTGKSLAMEAIRIELVEKESEILVV